MTKKPSELAPPKPKVEEDAEGGDDKSRWNKTYYEKHKEEILERRRQRYLEDPEYKQKLLRQSKEQQKRYRQERNARLKEQGIRSETPKLYRVQLPDGCEVETEMYSTSQLAMFLERKPLTIRIWEKLGLLPPSMYRSLQNRRLYTSFQVSEIVRYYKGVEYRFGKQRAMHKLSTTPFFRKIHLLWKNYPLGVKEHRGAEYAEDTED